MGPDTPPWSTRKATKDGKLQASPHSSEAMVNSTTETTNVRTTPKRCINQPVTGTDTPLATANAVITQVPWSVLTPRLPAIVGMDTFAIVVSSTCMNVPSANATAVKALRPPTSGGAPMAVLALMDGPQVSPPDDSRGIGGSDVRTGGP